MTVDEGNAKVFPGCDGSGISERAKQYRKDNPIMQNIKSSFKRVLTNPVPLKTHVVKSKNEFLKKNTTYKVVFNYPLGRDFEFEFVTTDEQPTTYDLIDFVAKIYQEEVYKDDESCSKYGVWGHDICDLVFEGFEIDVNGVDNTIHLLIGS